MAPTTGVGRRIQHCLAGKGLAVFNRFAHSAGPGLIRNSKLDLGTFKFESGASDLPPEGLKKRSCVEILDLLVKKASFLRLVRQEGVIWATCSSKRRHFGDLLVKKVSFGRLFHKKGVVWGTFSCPNVWNTHFSDVFQWQGGVERSRRLQGGSEEAPRMRQGGVREAPRIEQGNIWTKKSIYQK